MRISRRLDKTFDQNTIAILLTKTQYQITLFILQMIKGFTLKSELLHDFHSLLTKHGKIHRRITSRVASILSSLFSLKWCLENTGEITLTYKTIMEIMAIS